MSKSNNKKSFFLFKAILVFFALVIIIPAAWVGYRIHTMPTQITPYPYKITTDSFPQQALAEKASVLIVGDRMAQTLESYQNLLIEKSSKSLTSQLPVYNWAKEHENLARTLAKLRALKTIPSLIIYHGSSEEFYEKRFETKDIKRILKNFERQANPKLISLIMTVPLLSRVIYLPIQQVSYGEEIQKDSSSYNADERQAQFELTFNLYQIELRELISWSKEKKVQLLFINTPVNLEITPHQDCDNTTSESLKTYQEELRERISKDDLKSTQAELKELTQKIVGNALNFHLLGQTYLKSGQLLKAKEELIKGAAYDCDPWRINPVFNIIMEKAAQENNIAFIDFDKLVNKNLGQNATFISEIFPQNIYYQQLMGDLAQKTINLLHL